LIFDVQTILKAEGKRVPLQLSLLPPEAFSSQEIQFSDDASFSGELENIGGVLELSGQVSGTFTVPCARCMKITKQQYSISVNETYAHENAEVTDRDEVIPFSGTEIELDDAIWPTIFSELSSKYLCKPDCKGLCPKCGADLNEVACSCTDDEIDPRLAGLADLLK